MTAPHQTYRSQSFRRPSKEQFLGAELVSFWKQTISLGSIYSSHFKPGPNQQKILDLIANVEFPRDSFLHLLLYGGARSGKTYGVLAYTLDKLLNFPGTRALAVRRTQVDVKHSILKDAKDFLMQWGVPYSINETTGTITFPNSSEFYFRSDMSLVQAKKDKSDSVGGMSFSIVILEEVDSISSELADTIPSRMSQSTGAFLKCIFYLCNPPSKKSWVYLKFEPDSFQADDPKSRYRSLHCPISGNPFLPVGYFDAICEDYKKVSRNLYMRMVLGQWAPDVKGDPVFGSSFSEEIHLSASDLRAQYNPNLPLIRGWDFGWGCTVCITMQDDVVRGQIRVLDVFAESKINIDPFSQEVRRRHKRMFPGARVFKDYGDPSGRNHSSQSPKTIFDILRSNGINIDYTITDLQYGISIIEQQLSILVNGRPAILIDCSPDCELLVDAFRTGYCWEKGRTDGQTVPVKDGTYDHPMDAFRYALIHMRESNQRSQPARGHAHKEGWARSDLSGSIVSPVEHPGGGMLPLYKQRAHQTGKVVGFGRSRL